MHIKYAAPWDYKQRVKRLALVANNGSGKSALVLAPCKVWLAMTHHRARCVITSASGTQLDRQTGRSVAQLCEEVNAFYGERLWTIKYREYTFEPLRSTIEMYATDEAGKAEGYHPHHDSESQMFSMGCDEGKSISDVLFEPISRCNGMSHWVLVSSPGPPRGFFYNAVTSTRWDTTKVTAYDCPHIRQDEIEGAKEAYGEYSPFFRSAYLAEFTSVDEQVIIPYELIFKQIKEPPAVWDDGICRAGLDLSAGGDENVLSVWRGNKQVGLESFRFTDTVATRLHLQNLFRKYADSFGLKQEQVFADDGHVGRAIISELAANGWKINPVRFGSTAYNNVAYANRGTELWWNFSRILPHLVIMNDRTQTNQLSSRYYKQQDRNSKICLESKREAKANGHHSPDRADATVLAFARCGPDYFNKIDATPHREIDIGSLAKGLNLELLRSGKLTEEDLDKAVEIYRALKAQRMMEERKQEEQYYNGGEPTGVSIWRN